MKNFLIIYTSCCISLLVFLPFEWLHSFQAVRAPSILLSSALDAAGFETTVKAPNQSERPRLLLIYGPSCPYCLKVLDFLARIQKSVPLCNVRENRECIEKLLGQGKKGLVPCLFIDDFALYDANAIIEWLRSHQEWLDQPTR